MKNEQATASVVRHHLADVAGFGPERWVQDAVAQQEEHIARSTSCGGQLGLPHRWRQVGDHLEDGRAPRWEACEACGVTRTANDYTTMLRSRGHRPETTVHHDVKESPR